MDNGASSYRRFLNGDDSGLAEIVREYKDGLILYLQSFGADLASAEDLTEDTFFRLMIKKPAFSGKSSFKSWLYAIGRHIAIDWTRKNSRITDTPVEDLENVLQDEEDLERSYIREETKILVHRALGRLQTEYRQVIWLEYFEGFSHEETRRIMNKSSRQITNLLYRAKQSLKAELLKEGLDDEEFR